MVVKKAWYFVEIHEIPRKSRFQSVCVGYSKICITSMLKNSSSGMPSVPTTMKEPKFPDFVTQKITIF